jgi:hypothetical protein
VKQTRPLGEDIPVREGTYGSNVSEFPLLLKYQTDGPCGVPGNIISRGTYIVFNYFFSYLNAGCGAVVVKKKDGLRER